MTETNQHKSSKICVFVRENRELQITRGNKQNHTKMRIINKYSKNKLQIIIIINKKAKMPLQIQTIIEIVV